MAGGLVVCMILLTSVNTEEFSFQNKPLLSYFGKHNNNHFTNSNTSFEISKTTIPIEGEYVKNFEIKTEKVVNATPSKDNESNENNNNAKSIETIEDISGNQETSTLHNSQFTRLLKGIDKRKLDTNIHEKTTKHILNTKSIINKAENLTKTEEFLDKEDINTASSQIYTSYSKPTYQVYENIIDIPDDRKPIGPIIANYTKRPNFNTIIPTERSSSTERSKTRRNNKDIKKNDEILDFEIDYDNIKNVSNNKCKNKVNCLFKGIKDYFSGLHKDFVHGFHSIFKHN